jgi:threonine/homoserine/homoserine lactone efflux protein
VTAIVVGSLILFCLIKFGLDAISLEFPLFGSMISIAGAVYLMWLGLSLMQVLPQKSKRTREMRSMSTTGIVLFQLLNPKGWVLMSVFVAGSAESSSSDLLLVTILVVVVSTCMSLWALAGVAISSFYARRTPRQWIDGVMGASLLIFSGVLVTQQI